MPPLIGWAAVRNSLSLEAWVLYVHSLPLAVPAPAGHRLDVPRRLRPCRPANASQERPLRAGPPCGRFWRTRSALIPASLLPVFLGQVGKAYLVGALVLGGAFLHCGVRLATHRSNSLARRLVLASIVYLPLVFALMMVDKIPS